MRIVGDDIGEQSREALLPMATRTREAGSNGDQLGTSLPGQHTFCFLVLHPLQAPLIREGILILIYSRFFDMKSC